MTSAKPSTQNSLIQLAIALVLAVPMIGGYFYYTSTHEPGIQYQVGTNSGVTLDRYNQAAAGMSISKVETILGEGKELSRVEIPGTPLTVTYSWQNSDGSKLNITFQGNKLMSKAQAGLK